MGKYYYKKHDTKRTRKMARLLSIATCGMGFLIVIYVAFPLISYKLYFEPVFAQQDIATPIPSSTVVSGNIIQSLISNANPLNNVNYDNAQNWFPSFAQSASAEPRISSYTIAIPRLGITNANVSTNDNDLSKHLVNFAGTAVPPEKGNAVVFGHSTLPWLFDPNNYKAIFATALNMQVGDVIYATVSGIRYTYKVQGITVVDPTDISILAQTTDDSYLTIVTCTPPGTIWKRLVIKARLEKI